MTIPTETTVSDESYIPMMIDMKIDNKYITNNNNVSTVTMVFNGGVILSESIIFNNVSSTNLDIVLTSNTSKNTYYMKVTKNNESPLSQFAETITIPIDSYHFINSDLYNISSTIININLFDEIPNIYNMEIINNSNNSTIPKFDGVIPEYTNTDSTKITINGNFNVPDYITNTDNISILLKIDNNTLPVSINIGAKTFTCDANETHIQNHSFNNRTQIKIMVSLILYNINIESSKTQHIIYYGGLQIGVLKDNSYSLNYLLDQKISINEMLSNGYNIEDLLTSSIPLSDKLKGNIAIKDVLGSYSDIDYAKITEKVDITNSVKITGLKTAISNIPEADYLKDINGNVIESTLPTSVIEALLPSDGPQLNIGDVLVAGGYVFKYIKTGSFVFTGDLSVLSIMDITQIRIVPGIKEITKSMILSLGIPLIELLDMDEIQYLQLSLFDLIQYYTINDIYNYLNSARSYNQQLIKYVITHIGYNYINLLDFWIYYYWEGDNPIDNLNNYLSGGDNEINITAYDINKLNSDSTGAKFTLYDDFIDQFVNQTLLISSIIHITNDDNSVRYIKLLSDITIHDNNPIQLGLKEVFDGDGKTITIKNVEKFKGLFEGMINVPYTHHDGSSIIKYNSPVIKNVIIRLDNSTLSDEGGILITKDQQYFKVINCSSEGDIVENGGGICGSNCGRNGDVLLTNCRSSGNIGKNGGGIVGINCAINGNVIIHNCYSTGNIGENGGGLIGINCGYNNGNCIITSCYSSGNIGVSAGGICGFNTSNTSITSCYSTGDIENKGGGITGENTSNCPISQSYSIGNCTGDDSGGITGKHTTGITTTDKYRNDDYRNLVDYTELNGDSMVNLYNFSTINYQELKSVKYDDLYKKNQDSGEYINNSMFEYTIWDCYCEGDIRGICGSDTDNNVKIQNTYGNTGIQTTYTNIINTIDNGGGYGNTLPANMTLNLLDKKYLNKRYWLNSTRTGDSYPLLNTFQLYPWTNTYTSNIKTPTIISYYNYSTSRIIRRLSMYDTIETMRHGYVKIIDLDIFHMLKDAVNNVSINILYKHKIVNIDVNDDNKYKLIDTIDLIIEYNKDDTKINKNDGAEIIIPDIIMMDQYYKPY
jgi:hypothetical protein